MGKASRAKRDGSRRAWERRSRGEAFQPESDSLVDVHTHDELVGLAERGEALPCGCDAHQLLHGGGWQRL